MSMQLRSDFEFYNFSTCSPICCMLCHIHLLTCVSQFWVKNESGLSCLRWLIMVIIIIIINDNVNEILFTYDDISIYRVEIEYELNIHYWFMCLNQPWLTSYIDIEPKCFTRSCNRYWVNLDKIDKTLSSSLDLERYFVVSLGKLWYKHWNIFYLMGHMSKQTHIHSAAFCVWFT